jgi:hypothetical protein
MTSRAKISYQVFELPFMKMAEDSNGDDFDDEDIEEFEKKLPREAVFLGKIDDEVANFTSWKVDDHYYIIPWEGSDYDWALFRISWDDNWGRWGWSGDARIKGVGDRKEAAQLMLRGLFKRWKYDLRKREYAAYRELAEGV